MLIVVILAGCGEEESALPSGPMVNAPFSIQSWIEHWDLNQPRSVRITTSIDGGFLPGDLGLQIEMVGNANRESDDSLAANLQILEDSRVKQELEFFLQGGDLYALPDAALDNWIVVKGSESEDVRGMFADAEDGLALLTRFEQRSDLSHARTGPCGTEECHYLEGEDIAIAVHSGHWIPRYALLGNSAGESGEPAAESLRLDIIGWDEELLLAPPAGAREVSEDELFSVLFTLFAMQLL